MDTIVQRFFKAPIHTSCRVQGVDTQITVTAVYHPPERDPICCKCLKPCDVLTFEGGPWNADGGLTGRKAVDAVSNCCKAGYTMGPLLLEREHVEVNDVENRLRVSVMDSMFQAELEELEQSLLERFHAFRDAQLDDKSRHRYIALEGQQEALRQGITHRRIGA